VIIKLEDEEPKNFTYNITIKVPNKIPKFVSATPQNQTVALNSVLNYTLPAFSDPEGCSVTATLSTSAISSFVTLSSNTIKFAPTQYSQVGLTSITVTLTDHLGLSSNSSFTLTVTNLPPVVTGLIPTTSIVA
jgi:hypothetical protein